MSLSIKDSILDSSALSIDQSMPFNDPSSFNPLALRSKLNELASFGLETRDLFVVHFSISFLYLV